MPAKPDGLSPARAALVQRLQPTQAMAAEGWQWFNVEACPPCVGTQVWARWQNGSEDIAEREPDRERQMFGFAYETVSSWCCPVTRTTLREPPVAWYGPPGRRSKKQVDAPDDEMKRNETEQEQKGKLAMADRVDKYVSYRIQRLTLTMALEEEDYEPRFYDQSREDDRKAAENSGADEIGVHWCLRGRGYLGDAGPILFYAETFENVAEVYSKITGLPAPKLAGSWVGVIDLPAA